MVQIIIWTVAIFNTTYFQTDAFRADLPELLSPTHHNLQTAVIGRASIQQQNIYTILLFPEGPIFREHMRLQYQSLQWDTEILSKQG